MREFAYTITDTLGVHARPAGILVKEAERFESEITVENNGRIADAKRLFSLMGLGVKAGETVSVKISGDDEDTAAEVMENCFEKNL